MRSSGWFLAFLLSLFFAVDAYSITLYTYTNGGSTGLWSSAGTWTTDATGLTLVGSQVPANGDQVVILNGFTVTLNANVATTGHSITIASGGALDLATFTITPLSTLSGSGTFRLGAANFPAVTTNTFAASAASGATVVYYDFTGTLAASIAYPNLLFRNSTITNHTITFSNSAAYTLALPGTFTTTATGTGSLTVNFGTQATNLITITIAGNVTIGNNTRVGVGAFNAIHNMTLSGNLTNNGTIDFSNGTQYTASTTGAMNLTFTGATDNTFACNGLTDLYILTVNKGLSSTNILSVTSTNVANLNFYSVDQLIHITNGTLRLGTNISVTRMYGSGTTNYDVGGTSTSPMLWVDGATVNTNGSALVVYGKFRITSGSFTSLGGQGTVIREEGQYLIEGGSFTTEKFRPSSTATTHRGSFVMSGGTFNTSGVSGSDGTYARFSLPYPEQVFIMSGGVINVSNPQSGSGAANGGIHIGCNAANYNVTGGTINAILSGGAASFSVLSTAPFWDFNITRTAGPTTVRLAAIGSLSGSVTTAQPLTVLNDFTIDGVNAPVFDAVGLAVNIGGDFTINTGGTYTPNANTTTFNGAADQLFSNSGTITTALHTLTMNKSGGTLILGGTATTFTVSNQLNLIDGILNDGGKSLRAAGSVFNEATHTGTGNITLNGSSTQTISGDGTGIFGNLVLSNSSTPGANCTSDLSISGILTLEGAVTSLLDISQYTLSITSTSSAAIVATGGAFGTTKMIRTLGLQSDGGVRKTYGNLNAFIFPVGTGTSYTPATIQLTSAPTTYGSITVKPVDSRHPFVVSGNTNNLAYYWKTVSNGFVGLPAASVSHTYTYLESSVTGGDVNYVPARYFPATWTVIADLAQVNETTNVIAFTSVNYIDGEFTAGFPAAFGTVRVFYSIRSGNWTDTNPATTPWSNVSHSGTAASTYPVVGDNVFIGDGVSHNHTITITSNAQASGGLEISSGSVLDVGVYTGHNFGTFENTSITGSGLLRISSATATAEFPAGDFGNFIRNNGGTVEYYSTGTQDFSIPLMGSTPTDLPLISYKNLILSPATGRFITMPDQDMRLYGNMLVQGSSSTGVARLNTATTRTLTINGNLSVISGNLQFRSGTAQVVEVDGNVSTSSGATIDQEAGGTATTNTFIISGNLLNHGVTDFFHTASYVTNVTFTGNANTSITGSGSVTDFNILTVSKGTSQTPVLEVNASAFSLSGSAQPLILTNGTFRMTSSQSVTIANNVDFNIPATARLSANGGTLQTTGSNGNDLLVTGTLEVLAGTINVGTTANDNSVEYSATGSPTITASGGTLNIRGQVRRSFASTQGGLIYNQSGTSVVSVGLSSVTTTTRGVFEMLNTGSSFSMSGGTLRINRALGTSAISDLYLQPATSNVTGGTVEIGGVGTAQTIDVNTIIALHNFSVTGTSNVSRLEFNGLTLRGSLSIAPDNIFQASGFNVNVAGNFSNANTSSTTGTSAGGYQPGSSTQTTTVNGSVNNQTITGVSGNLTNFANLTFNNTFPSGTITLQPNSNLRVHGTLTFTNGTVAGGDNVITALGTISNSSIQTNTASGSVTLAGSSAQVLTGNGSGRFGNVTLNNSSGAVFGSNQEIAGVLTFTAGTMSIGSFNLNLSNTSLSAIAGATSTRYIITSGNLSDGGVTKAFAASVTSGNFIYPIGSAGKYTPANYTITTGAIGGNITIRPVNSKHPSATGSGTAYIRYYWSVTSSVIIINSLTHTYTYNAADENGTVADYRDARFKAGAWTIGITAGNPNTTSRIITFTNTDVAGDYSAGEATAFVNPTTYTSIASGNWESDLAVWDIDPPGTGLGPPAGSFVIISAGHTVTITNNTKRLATLDIRGRLHVAGTIGHDFGTVSTGGAGARTMQLQSSTFPTGDFTSFTATNGGTVEYDGTVVLPTQSTYNHLAFSSAGTKTLPNADLTINGNFNVLAGTVTNAVNNRSVVLISSSGDFTNNGVFSAGTGVVIIGRNLTNTGAGAIFNSGSGTLGMLVTGTLTNSSGAIFNCASDSVGVRGFLNNSATFNASSGEIHITKSLTNSGTFTGGTGAMAISGSLTNTGTFTASTGAITIRTDFANTGAAATYGANANALTVGGNFVNNTSSVFNGHTGTITLGGDWTNSATFTPGTNQVTFNSASARQLTGSTTFFNLRKLNGGSLTLNSSVSVSGTLTLTSGNLITGTNVLSLTNTAAQPVIGFGTASYVDGRLSISYPNTAATGRTYPMGKGTTYRPVTLVQTAASTAPVVRIEMINTSPTGSFPAEVGNLSEARYYSIDLLSGTMNAPTLELHFNTNGTADENITVPGNARVMRATSSGGPWTNEGGSGVFSPAAPAGYATSGVTSVASTTFFTLGYQAGALPITLRRFDARLKDGVVELEWETLTEKNNAFFTLERSTGDELRFDSLFSQPGAGNSFSPIVYHDIDPSPLPGLSYYRLKQTDLDGRFSYSDIVAIQNNEPPMLHVYPNPGKESSTVYLRLANHPDTMVQLAIVSVAGNVIYSGFVDLKDPIGLSQLVHEVVSGAYVVKVRGRDFYAVQKLLIH